jgi:hypothetical protein
MSKRARNIIVILIIGIIHIQSYRNRESNYPSEPSKSSFTQQASTYNPTINPIPSSYSYSFNLKDDPKFDRDEIFKKTVKEYREYTYWGSEHPIKEKTRHLNNDEVEIIDADNFWGAEY